MTAPCRKNTSSPTKAGTLAIAPIVLDITDAMRERLYGADVGETALYYGQYCEREKDRKGVWGYTGIHEGIDFVNVKGAPLYAILGGEVTRGRGQERAPSPSTTPNMTSPCSICTAKTASVRRGDTVEAGDMIAKEGKTNISGGANTHYTHVELRKGRHTSSSPYRDTVLTSDCPYAVMQQALGVMESGRQPVTAAAVQQAQRMREEAEAKAKAEAEAAQKAAEEEAKAQAEAEQNADITLVDALPGTTAGYGFGNATATPEATATPVPEATLPPTNP